MLTTLLTPTQADAQAPSAADRPPVIVAAIVYSGQPDPTWTLDAAQIVALRERLSRLPGTPEMPPEPDRLGYVSVFLQPRIGAIEVITVDHGAVRWERGKSLTWRADPDRKLEKWLLAASGNPKLDIDFIDSVRRAH